MKGQFASTQTSYSNSHSQYSEQILKDLSFCVIDLETTGGNHLFDKIIEIGLIKIHEGKIVSEMSFLINPEIPIPEFIQKLTSIHENEIKESPKIEEIIDQILKFMGDSILVAHNSSFDIPFFNSVLKRLQRPALTNKTLCTNLLTKNLIPEIINSNLPYLTKLFQIEHQKAHRALEDAKATAHLLLFFLKIFSEKNIKKINQIYYPRNKFELDTCHFKNQSEILKYQEKFLQISTPMTAILKGEKGVLIDILPIQNFADEKEYFFNVFLKRPWNTLTIKLRSSLVASFNAINLQINKLNQESFNQTLTYLEKKYGLISSLSSLSASSALSSPPASPPANSPNFEEMLFITPHLIPEQMVIITLDHQFQKKDFIFRFPNHQQKFFQHLAKIHKKYVHYKNTVKTGKNLRPETDSAPHDNHDYKEKEQAIEFTTKRFQHFLAEFFSKQMADQLFMIPINAIGRPEEFEKIRPELLRFLGEFEHHNRYNFPITHL